MVFKLTTSWAITLTGLAILMLSLTISQSALAAGCTVNCLSVYSITLSDRGTSVRGIVKLVDETRAGAGARGTVVHAIWERPDGTTFVQHANIGTRLRATFNLYTAGASGEYKLTVEGATKAGYTFDPVNSSLLSQSITNGDMGNQTPTAVPNVDSISGSVPLTVNFDSSGSFDRDGMIVAYDWDFGDGNNSTEADPRHTYTKIGNYSARLTVTDNMGASASQTIAIAVAEDNAGCISNCLSVDRIAVGYRKQLNKAKGSVWLVDENGHDVTGAKVHAMWTLPNGSTVDQYRKTKNKSKASFGLVADMPGKYELTVIEVIMPGYTFDLDNSNVLNGMAKINP